MKILRSRKSFARHLALRRQIINKIGLEMAWAAKKPANEPLTGLFTGPLTAQFYLCFLLGRYRTVGNF